MEGDRDAPKTALALRFPIGAEACYGLSACRAHRVADTLRSPAAAPTGCDHISEPRPGIPHTHVSYRREALMTTQVSDDLDEMLEAAVPPPSCEWQRKGEEPCGAPATLIMSLSCGHSYYYDDEHGERMEAVVHSPGRNACADPRPPRHPALTIVEARFDRIAS